jgi:hypothetical protein
LAQEVHRKLLQVHKVLLEVILFLALLLQMAVVEVVAVHLVHHRVLVAVLGEALVVVGRAALAAQAILQAPHPHKELMVEALLL